MQDLRRKVFVTSYNSILQKVYELCRTGETQLTISNLPQLPAELMSNHSMKSFNDNSYASKKPNLGGFTSPRTVFPLVKQIVLNCGIDVLKTGVLKLFLCGLSFASPILLGLIVSYLGDDGGPSSSNISYGLALIALLAACSILSAALNTNFNIRSWVIKCRLIGALSPLIFARSLALPICAWPEMGVSEAQVNNLIQIDVEQLSGCFNNLHDLWALPVQIIVTFVLLYLKIRLAFLAGVAVIVCMLPVNSVRATTDIVTTGITFSVTLLLLLSSNPVQSHLFACSTSPSLSARRRRLCCGRRTAGCAS